MLHFLCIFLFYESIQASYHSEKITVEKSIEKNNIENKSKSFLESNNDFHQEQSSNERSKNSNQDLNLQNEQIHIDDDSAEEIHVNSTGDYSVGAESKPNFTSTQSVESTAQSTFQKFKNKTTYDKSQSMDTRSLPLEQESVPKVQKSILLQLLKNEQQEKIKITPDKDTSSQPSTSNVNHTLKRPILDYSPYKSQLKIAKTSKHLTNQSDPEPNFLNISVQLYSDTTQKYKQKMLNFMIHHVIFTSHVHSFIDENFVNLFLYEKKIPTITKKLHHILDLINQKIIEIQTDLLQYDNLKNVFMKGYIKRNLVGNEIFCSLCMTETSSKIFFIDHTDFLSDYYINIKNIEFTYMNLFTIEKHAREFFSDYISLFRDYKSFRVIFSSNFRSFYQIFHEKISVTKNQKISLKEQCTKITAQMIHEQLHKFLTLHLYSKILLLPEFHSLVYFLSGKNVLFFGTDNQKFPILFFYLLSLNLFFDSVCYNHEIDDLLTGGLEIHVQKFLLSTISFTLRLLFIRPLINFLYIPEINQIKYYFLVFNIFKYEIDRITGKELNVQYLCLLNEYMCVAFANHFDTSSIRFVDALKNTHRSITVSNKDLWYPCKCLLDFKIFLNILFKTNHQLALSNKERSEIQSLHFLNILSNIL